MNNLSSFTFHTDGNFSLLLLYISVLSFTKSADGMKDKTLNAVHLYCFDWLKLLKGCSERLLMNQLMLSFTI